ncbi:endolytic transglycosylase MltG [Streptomyces sp. SID14515]|uniref:endolytic transglycosylase MltG n=1 Tax=Streptomyces sp. SID14515 TaxID=2706074 RepID=UPI0013C6666F|nr:endolytic transglycosylase MltG [Streptomyces sp. SID14515]NEB35556.1 endolytic transglycosylase MltG [Streptomyces sp. SID14515]
MTEYGRGPGSEPWHPEDPLYGDQGWGGRQAAHGQGQYGDQQQSYPQDPYAQQHQNHQQYPPQPYDQQQHQHQQQYGQQPQQNHQQQYGTPQQDPYAQQSGAQPQYNGGWGTGQQAAMPYGAEPQDPYAQQSGGYDATQDYYGTPEAYPPPQPPGRREAAPEQQEQHQHQQQPSTDWDPDEPQEETHPFFTGADDPAGREPRDGDDDPDDDGSRASRRGGKGKKKKSRSGCACLVVSVVLLGGLGGVSYVGYTFWKKQFGAPADFAGSGTGEVEVEIPEGSLGYDIANILRKKGVIKSSDAFVAAQNDNPKGKLLQAGVYLMKKEMSAASAIDLMLDPKSQNAFVIPEGTRNIKVYAEIDKRLELEKGTTAKIAKTKAESLGLPDWADDNPDVKDPLEGFLYPAAYPVAKGSKPEDALKRMVARANKEYENIDFKATAKKYNLDGPWQVLTVASLVQAEGLTHDDFRKMAEVVYNRLEPDNTITNRKLEFDSAFNYLKNQSKITIGSKEIRTNPDPYNTYYHTGLPPGPIGNPGMDAIKASLNPTGKGWMFFISLDGKKTEFTKTVEEHEKLNEKWKEQQGLG